MDESTQAFWFGAFLTLVIIIVCNAIGCINKYEKNCSAHLPYDKIVEYKYVYTNESSKASRIAEISKLIDESDMVIDNISTMHFNELGNNSTTKHYVVVKAQKRSEKKKENSENSD